MCISIKYFRNSGPSDNAKNLELGSTIWINLNIFSILTIGSRLDRNSLFIIDHNVFVNIFEDVIGVMTPFAASTKVDGENKCNNHRDAHHNSNNQEGNRFWKLKKKIINTCNLTNSTFLFLNFHELFCQSETTHLVCLFKTTRIGLFG